MTVEMKVAIKDGSERTIVEIGENATCGGKELLIVGGPCSVESMEQMETVAEALSGTGVSALRGGVFKPRTSTYAFQGLREAGLDILQTVSKKHRMPVITEVMSESQAIQAAPLADALQIGSRNMQNFELLKVVGTLNVPIILKRGLSATLEEMVMAAEYIAAGGNMNIILCERGIRSFDPSTRNVLDLGGVVALKQMTHLPVIVDPSHATGRRELVADLARAAIAAGADGLMIECHPIPEESVSDARQAISLQDMIDIVESIRPIAKAVGRTIGDEPIVTTDSTLSRLKSTIGVLEESRRNERDILSVCEDRRTGPAETLSDLRREIDLVDLEIAALLEQRLNLALQIGGVKQKHDIPWRDLHRERDVLNSVTASSADRRTSNHIRQIYERLIELTTAAQAEQTSTSTCQVA